MIYVECCPVAATSVHWLAHGRAHPATELVASPLARSPRQAEIDGDEAVDVDELVNLRVTAGALDYNH